MAEMPYTNRFLCTAFTLAKLCAAETRPSLDDSIQLSVRTLHYQNQVFHLNLLLSRIVADKKSACPPLTEPLETLIHVDRHRVGCRRNRYMLVEVDRRY
jgi:hypothetical protein